MNKKDLSVVSFETAKELNNAGFIFDTAFCYSLSGELHLHLFDADTGGWFSTIQGGEASYENGRIPAPTFTELWDALPKDVTVNGNIYYLYVNTEDDYIEYYNSVLRKECISVKIKDGLTEAAAELLLILKAKGLV